MKIGFIGGGRVGRSFGKYLVNKGFEVTGYYSRSYTSAITAASYTNSTAYDILHELIEDSDAIFITTPDDSIKIVCNEMVESGKLKKGQILIHMSGAHSSSILQTATEFGCHIYSLHPLQAFANIDVAVEKLKNTVFSLEGDNDNIEKVIDILKACGNEYFIIDGENKALYHGAACVASNYLVTLMDLSLKMLEAAGIEPMYGFKAMSPLIYGSLENIMTLGASDALTGPIPRGDLNTIERHLKAMEDKLPNEISLYKKLGDETTKLASRKKLKDTALITSLNKLWKEEII
ncbi:Predicted oxidoreductase, contains short-chain dehydrogenase (SDR) and DUF2520 domains [Alkaliphilus peptidifermentans DSM 18978]|uniref:Predicted oxidoreductase, contains short-chain dehydrogenase (SDR) and DUF2520 domains n=2 Tax=Alkaliphilus TaxID=114627 RepID=A0A1G5HS31_9FIRM|nr:Predicted oxidoreductase, contains short-chain dehydrogenase (SDR) and DUF2520 domains [Alkaliphilus peptidifermentans DSM 18978]